MVKVTHFWGGKRLSGSSESPSFILTNNAGSFACFSGTQSSKFEGFFANIGSGIFRTIESIALPGNVEGLANRFYCIERKRGGLRESFFVPPYRNSLCYELSGKSEFDVFLDFRKAYDFRQWGRFYRSYEKGNAIVVEFVKKTDAQEDKTNGVEEFRLYLAIMADGSHENIGEWVRRGYGADRARNSASERYVYNALRINASKAVFSVAASETAAVSEAEYIFSSLDCIRRELKGHCKGSGSIECNAAISAFESLATRKGIYAGLPWFFQHWSRDTLISLPAAHSYIRKKVVLSYARKVGNDGRIPNVSPHFNGSPHGSSDAVGWLFLRARQLYEEGLLTKSEQEETASALKKSLLLQQKNYGKGGLIFSGRNETWMDTNYNDNGREGFPIEIQALALASYNLLWLLTKDKKAKAQEAAMSKRVRKQFWNGRYLNDLAGDATIRPNIFIAAYAYPQLLAKKEWEACIDNILPNLWLEWGGLASIDKKHPLFQPNYTGEDNRSYHRGDSWFWINNLAAMVMRRINRAKYRSYIEKIKSASVRDLLWNGAVGCCSELSSASQQRAEGCLNQAWSCSTLAELLRL